MKVSDFSNVLGLTHYR